MNHYRHSKMEAIEVMRNSMTDDEFEGFLKGNVYKYLHRYKHKGEPDKDLEKAITYLQALARFHADSGITNPFRED